MKDIIDNTIVDNESDKDNTLCIRYSTISIIIYYLHM